MLGYQGNEIAQTVLEVGVTDRRGIIFESGLYSFLLSDNHTKFAGAANAGVKQITIEELSMTAADDKDHVIGFGPLELMDGCGIGQREFFESRFVIPKFLPVIKSHLQLLIYQIHV